MHALAFRRATVGRAAHLYRRRGSRGPSRYPIKRVLLDAERGRNTPEDLPKARSRRGAGALDELFGAHRAGHLGLRRATPKLLIKNRRVVELSGVEPLTS